MNYQFLDRFTPSQCSENTPVDRALKNQTRSESSLRQNRIKRTRSESRQLLDEIRRRTSGGRSAQTAQAEIQVLLNDTFKVNQLLDTQVSPLKFARVSQRGTKSNAASAAAQRLRSQSGQAACSNNTNKSLHSEFCMPEGRQMSIDGATCDCEKENHDPATPCILSQAQYDALEDVSEDLPISSWPHVRQSREKGSKERYGDSGVKTAASGLMRLSHLR